MARSSCRTVTVLPRWADKVKPRRLPFSYRRCHRATGCRQTGMGAEGQLHLFAAGQIQRHRTAVFGNEGNTFTEVQAEVSASACADWLSSSERTCCRLPSLGMARTRTGVPRTQLSSLVSTTNKSAKAVPLFSSTRIGDRQKSGHRREAQHVKARPLQRQSRCGQRHHHEKKE